MPRGINDKTLAAAAEWDWLPIVATVIAVAMAALITIAAAYVIGASVQLCPRELAVWSHASRSISLSGPEAAHGGSSGVPVDMNTKIAELRIRHNR